MSGDAYLRMGAEGQILGMDIFPPVEFAIVGFTGGII